MLPVSSPHNDHKITIQFLSTQPLVPLIYDRPTFATDILILQWSYRTWNPNESAWSWADPGRRFLCIIITVPWTDLFVVKQDGVPSGKSFQYPRGSLHW